MVVLVAAAGTVPGSFSTGQPFSTAPVARSMTVEVAVKVKALFAPFAPFAFALTTVI
jgi:hypothetical protein